MHKAVFLDRDGVINSDKDHYYIYRIEDFILNDGIIEGLQLLIRNKFLLFIVSNQGGIAKGIYTNTEVEKLHAYLKSVLVKHRISIKNIYYCPHHENIVKCKCRKPPPYFILKAAKRYQVNLKESFFIGNSKKDMKAAQSAGIKGIRICDNENIVPYCKMIIKKKYG